MKAVIESNFKVREKHIGSYYSFPVYSDHIENTLTRLLEFHKRCDHPFTLELKIIQE
jgi:hypothetical protein